MSDEKHPALLQAERDRALEQLNQRINDLELRLSRTRSGADFVDRIRALGRS